MKRNFFSPLTKAAYYLSLLILLAFSNEPMWGQPTKNTPAPPTHVQATDGVFTDRIDVSWTKEMGQEYRIYRGTTPSVADMKLVNNTWYTYNYFSDRSRLDAGKRYFYRVKTRKNGQTSNFSTADEGFTLLVAGSRKMMDKTENPMTANALPIEMTVNKLEKDTLKAGENFDISYALLNRSKEAAQNMSIYFYLSTDDKLDKNDALLDVAPLDTISMNRLRRGAVSLKADAKTPNGGYFILIKLEPAPMIIAKKIVIN